MVLARAVGRNRFWQANIKFILYRRKLMWNVKKKKVILVYLHVILREQERRETEK